jgi:hypothetical protein
MLIRLLVRPKAACSTGPSGSALSPPHSGVSFWRWLPRLASSSRADKVNQNAGADGLLSALVFKELKP